MADHTGTDMEKALFANLIMMLSSSAMQQLGKLVNPMTNETEVNLEGAQLTIDMISMLRTKTQGNLTAEEKKTIDDLLTSLQMNYVAVSQSRGAKETKAPADKPAADATQEANADDAGTATANEEGTQPPPGEDPPEPKFHKSYG